MRWTRVCGDGACVGWTVERVNWDSRRLGARPVALEAAQQALHALLDPASHGVGGRSRQAGGQAGRTGVQAFLVAELEGGRRDVKIDCEG